MNILETPFTLGQCTVEPPLNQLSGPTGSVRLQPRIMFVLQRLAASPHEMVARDELLEVGWEDPQFVSDEALTKAISLLRKAIRDSGETGNLIRTVPKRGYVLSIVPRPIKKPEVPVAPQANDRPVVVPQDLALQPMQRSGYDGRVQPWFAAVVLMLASFWMGRMMPDGIFRSVAPVPLSIRVAQGHPGQLSQDFTTLPVGALVLSDSTWTSPGEPQKRMRRVSMAMPGSSD